MASTSRSLSDLRRKRGQELAALNRIERRGFALLDIDGTRDELWAILKELDDALQMLQDANWNYFDSIGDDEFERLRAERYEEKATEKCTALQDLILSRLRERTCEAASEDRQKKLNDADLSTSYASIKSYSNDVQRRIQNDEGSTSDERNENERTNWQRTNEVERTSQRASEQRPNPSNLFRSSLPSLKLEAFNGNVADWPRWYSLFKSLVDDQPMSNDEKMAHLQSAVTGLARHTIGGMLFNGSLYHDALTALKDRFGRDEDIVHANLSQIFSASSPVYLDPSSLEKFHGAVHCAVTVLQNMGYEGDLRSTENLRRAVQKLPSELKRDWGEYAIDIHKPNMIHFDSWLQRQVRIALNYAAVSTSTSKRLVVPPEPQHISRNMRSTERSTYSTETTAGVFVLKDCACCNSGTHQLDECPSFKQMTPGARSKFVFSNRRCFSCLKRGHVARYCKSRAECGINNCKLNHHKMLHDNVEDKGEENEHRSIAAIQKCPQTLLQVVPVRVHGAEGRTRETLALLDPGSQTSLCTDDVINELQIAGDYTQLVLKHIGGTGPPQRSRRVKLTLSPLADGRQILVPEAFSVPEVNVRTPVIPSNSWKHWKHLTGLPIQDCTADKIELLLGANVLEAVLQQEIRVGSAGQPVAVRTAFGWALTGSVSDFVPGTIKEIMHIDCTPEEHLGETIINWWTTESFGTKFTATDNHSREDALAKLVMEQTTRKCGDRYEVGLLWRNPAVIMPENKAMAVSRLKSLERSLLNQPVKAKAYQENIQKYIASGHARKVPHSELAICNTKRWYLPHHAVANPHKKGLRVVFDAAARFAGKSLNDELLKGPDLLQNLVGILLRFRQERVAIVADVEQMFHQIRIIEEDQPAMSFLWRDLDTDKEPDEYQMTVSIFGMKCSPAIANYVLRRTAEEHAEETPDSKAAVLAVKQNFYMDDFLKSEANVAAAITMQREVTKLVASGGFRLTKWMSNNVQVLENIDISERAREAIAMPRQRALGCTWMPLEDALGVQSQVNETSFTKRGILRSMASVFDPLGLASPFTVKAKILIQRLWALKYSWDEQLRGSELAECQLWLSQASHLQEIRVPRCFKGLDEDITRYELHVFCDASESCFAAVAYILTIASDGSRLTSFVMSRTRLAPLKQLTIVRLELQAAVLAVRLADTIKREISYRFDETLFWSDSKVVLHYIRNESRRFHTFVANRISEIQESSSIDEWHHISGKSNPADVASRGASLEKLKDLQLWWRGPVFLGTQREDWPEQPDMDLVLASDDTEVKVAPMEIRVITEDNRPKLLDTKRFSSWNKYRRTVAWIMRFVQNVKARRNASEQDRFRGPLSSKEIKEAEVFILREEQTQDGRRLSQLAPFEDERGLQRVGGRLGRAPMSYVSQHPIIMSSSSDITRLIVCDIHEKLFHSGLQHTLNEFRLKYWMPKARGTVRRILNGCIFCRNRRARPRDPLMASLPEVRLDQSRPFRSVGIDYFGPLLVRKFRKTEKRFVLLVTCLATRALHLELAGGLDTDSFLMALRRFMARRGRPAVICSDRGTNFVGGERALREGIEAWNETQITDYLSQHHVEWKWNPPAAPHMGGAWERLVASVKRALRAVLGPQCVPEDVLHTVLVEVEYMLNGRPLTYVSSDERDPESLTPNHFLLQTPDSGAGLPPGVFGELDYVGRRRWRHSQTLANQMWKRWRKEFLPTLIARQKWVTDTPNLRVDDVVLIYDESAPRGHWPLAKVTQVYPSSDGIVRSADVKTASGTYRRPVNKLCLLENLRNC